MNQVVASLADHSLEENGDRWFFNAGISTESELTKVSTESSLSLFILTTVGRDTILTSFRFDETKSFDANLQVFLDHMQSTDPEMGRILNAYAMKLKGATDDGKRRTARTDFNKSVKLSLDELTAHEDKGDSR